MAQKPSIPKGTRDFNPEQVAKRNYIFQTIQKQFETFGFQPIETPSFENSDTLMGKYGEEGDRLIFKILNSGDYLKDLKIELEEAGIIAVNFFHLVEGIKQRIFQSMESEYSVQIPHEVFLSRLQEGLSVFFSFSSSIKKVVEEYFLNNENQFLEFISDIKKTDSKNITLIENSFKQEFFKEFWLDYLDGSILDLRQTTKNISEKALRYDLTVPFARYVVQHQNEIEFPFKRYQMQPVWRADRPQKGRFREFYQCDADVVGSTSLWQEVEFVQLYDSVFSALKLEGVTIKINNRKILSGIAEVIGASDKLIDFTVALDKLDKIGEEKVKAEMLEKGISEAGIIKLQPLFTLSGDFNSQIEQLKTILSSSEEGRKGIDELAFIDKAISELGLQTAKLQLDVTLARGLNYYTGAIFEVSAPEGVQMGSIGGGGRYDDLTGIFGMPDMSGVGISFGLDRIYLVLEEMNLFPETVTKNIDVLFINFGEAEALFSLKAIKQLRSYGINAELYPDNAKMKKQMNHANKRQIPFVVLVGDNEMEQGKYTLKNMALGDQFELTLQELVEKFA